MLRRFMLFALAVLMVSALTASASRLIVVTADIGVYNPPLVVQMPLDSEVPTIFAPTGIHPYMLLPASRGNYFMTWVELPQWWNVADIDISTVELCLLRGGCIGAEPDPTEVGDEDGDGSPDRMFRFDRQAVSRLLAGRYGLLTLVLRGKVSGYTFEGQATIDLPTPTPEPTATPTPE